MAARVLAGLALVVLTVWRAWPAAAWPADVRPAALAITVAPSDISLLRDAPSDVLVVLRNVSAENATDIKLQSGPENPVVKMTVPTNAPDALAPGASESVVVTVVRVADTTADSVALVVVATYHQSSVAGTVPVLPAIAEVATAPLNAKPVAPPELVAAAFKANIDPISTDRPAQVALLLTNPQSGPVSVTALNVESPQSVITKVAAGAVGQNRAIEVNEGHSADLLAGGAPLELAPRTTTAVPITLGATGSVVPGARSLLVHITARSGGAGAPAGATTDTVVAQDFKVEVYGESAILGALGVPMLLLLPGVIILTTVGVLLRYASPWRGLLTTGSTDLTAKATFGAVASVLVSLVMVLVYPVVTRVLPGQSHNLRRSYGFDDFYYVYLWSLIVALLLWGVLSAAKRELEWAFIPTRGDDPWALLRKLQFRRAPLAADLITVKGAPTDRKHSLHVTGSFARWYLAPPAKVTFADGASADDPPRKRIEDAMAAANLRSLRAALVAARKAGVVTGVAFQEEGFVADVGVVTPDQTDSDGIKRNLVEI